jgi:integrase
MPRRLLPSTSTSTAIRKIVLSELTNSQPHIVYLRDGELVVYRRDHSPVWQCRFKRQDGKWHRQTTTHYSLENAIATACDLYDQARYRQRLGLAHETRTFAQIARATLAELRNELDLGRGKSVYATYITCIEKYFLPYFNEQLLEQIKHKDIMSFELWRNQQMNKQPKASTLNNFSSAWNRLIQTAVNRGWISSQVPIPKLSTQGVKSKPRPAFTRPEIDQLLLFMKTWRTSGKQGAWLEMRLLLCDYIEMLLYTGMRHGTEAMGLRWCDISWHEDKGQQYLRLWVNGKTGGRFIIAKHAALPVLERLYERQIDIKSDTFHNLLRSNITNLAFRFSTGYQPPNLNGAFKRLMRDSGLLKDVDGQNRTLYSLRHTYATFELLENSTDIHTLSKQMGNSAAMIERHYSKLTATMAAEKLA